MMSPDAHAMGTTPDTSNMTMSSTSTTMRTGKCLSSVMLWNWETIDLCLFSRQWHIASNAQFAATCIAIIVLAMSVGFFRRLTKEYDVKILKDYQKRCAILRKKKSGSIIDSRRSSASFSSRLTVFLHHDTIATRFRPDPVQQIVRALLHLSQFVIGYFLML
jgi:copper transporter 1